MFSGAFTEWLPTFGLSWMIYTAMTAWFRGGAWEFHYLDAPVLALAARTVTDSLA